MNSTIMSINNITNEAKEVIKTIATKDIIFMKEHYISDGCDSFGPYHHIWNFYIFMRNSNGEIEKLHFNREYNENFEKNDDYPYEQVLFTDIDFTLLQRIIEEDQIAYE